MSEILFYYHRVNPTTWVYLSSLLMIGLFFKFSRFWSVRNLDLVLLLMLAPGLLLADYGYQMKKVAAGKLAAVERHDDGAPVETPEDTPFDAEASHGKSGATEGNGADSGDGGEPIDASAIPETSQDDGDDDAPSANRSDSPKETGKATDSAEAGDSAVDETPEEAALKRGKNVERLGYIFLFAVGALLLLRLLLDPTMVRRPLLEPNLSVGGMTFIGCSLFVFLMANVITSTPGEVVVDADFGPGYRLIRELPPIPTSTLVENDGALSDTERRQIDFAVPAKIIVILAHLAIVIGMTLIGYRHFDNIRMGIGAATLYLMLPYTAQMTGRPYHAIPGALLVWAIVCYRRPFMAGVFIGLAGVVYYPLYLLPLWLSFYWHRGKMRYAVGVLSMLGVLILTLMLLFGVGETFWAELRKTFGLWRPVMEDLAGFWNYHWAVYRIPLLAAFIALSCSFALWPPQKNLGTLLCCSAALMLAAQFWHGHGGGTYMAWYVPLLLLTIFRPNLEDRVALAVLGEGWFPRRRPASPPAG